MIGGYEAFGRSLAQADAPAFDDVDTYGAPEAWHEAWLAMNLRLQGATLVKRILPMGRGLALRDQDYSRLTAAEVVQLLDRVHTDLNSRNAPRWLSRENLRVGFTLWTRPLQAVETPEWKSSIFRLLDDRPTSRAIRYAALRYRASRQLSLNFGDGRE